jgi:hypothetical protein
LDGLARCIAPAVQRDGQGARRALPGGLETGDAVTLGSSFKSDEPVEVTADPSTTLVKRIADPQ